MSYVSISHLDTAIEHINSAIDYYNQAIDDIKVDNKNVKSDEILDLIEIEKGNLVSLKHRINSLESNISMALDELERRRKEEKEKNTSKTK